MSQLSVQIRGQIWGQMRVQTWIRQLVFVSAVACGLTGCMQDTIHLEGEVVAANPPTGTKPVEVLPPATQLVCESTPAWWTGYDPDQFELGSASLHISPDAQTALMSPLFGADTDFVRLADGQTRRESSFRVEGVLDTSWRWEIRQAYAQDKNGKQIQTLEVRELGAVEPLRQIAIPELPGAEYTYVLQFAIASAGDQVVALVCGGSGTEPNARVVTFGLESGQPIRSVELGEPCSPYSFPDAGRLRMSADARLTAVVLPGASQVWVVDAQTDGVKSVDAAPPLADDNRRWIERPIIDVALSPDGKQVAVVGLDGWLRRFSTETLQQLGAPKAAQVMAVHQFTYQPTFASPLAFTADSSHLAWLAGPNRLEVLRAADGAHTAKLVMPELQRTDLPEGAQQAPLAIAFVGEGQGLVASAEFGRGLWRCATQAN